MADLAVIYYSSNQEDPLFEKRIQEALLKSGGDLPIISVTQKPTDLGKNIVVGDVGVSGFNMFRQVQIALQNTDAKFVISAEADCVYPPDYFTFAPGTAPFFDKPIEDMCYRDTNLYVMGDHRDYWFYKKEGATHAQIVGRGFYLKTLDKLFKGAPQWSPEEKNFPKERSGKEDVFDEIIYYRTPNPVFQIKTHRSMRYFTHSQRVPIYELPYWGEGKKVREFYMKGVEEKYVS